jgi:hypothetical protein
MRRIHSDRVTLAGLLLASVTAFASCGDERPAPMADGTDDGPPATQGDDGVDDGADDSSSGGGEKLDIGGMGPPLPVGCGGDADCELIDVLFVIDNSGTMGEEQLNLARNFPLLVERLQNLKKPGGDLVNADVNVMVTTTDFGHPLCTDFETEEYQPAMGSPIFTGCNSRIESFTSNHPFDPIEIPEACTTECPEDLLPGGDPFIHFDPTGTNVTYNDISGALSCVAPQGINGCGFEAPLESMLHALRPDACWNDPHSEACEDDEQWGWVNRGFIRHGSTLAIAIITDEADCSVASPTGFSYFTDQSNPEYWLTDPEAGVPLPSSAVCWNAGVNCTDENDDGVYESCVSNPEDPALHPVARYKDFLAYLEQEKSVDIVMLGVLGVPPVTAHDPNPPFAPIEGGVQDLVYRDWKDGVYDGTPEGGDILPLEWDDGITAAHKQWEFGIGPGCTGVDAEGAFTGQAAPDVRILEVCESLNEVDELGNEHLRCCVESICDDDFSPALDCLTGIIQETINPVG